MLAKSKLSFSHNIFYSIRELYPIGPYIDIIFLFAAELEEPKIGISGKGLTRVYCVIYVLQVIQMYVKPDTVSYSQNFLPGQTVIHKPQIKKKTAELKCVICNTKFFSLYDMREHVKYPCQKVYKDSTDSDSDIHEESVNFKIRRVELDQELAIKSSTALSVLAEASKHVESLSHRHPIKTEVISTSDRHADKCLQTIPAVEQVVEVAPVYPSYQNIEQESTGLQTYR